MSRDKPKGKDKDHGKPRPRPRARPTSAPRPRGDGRRRSLSQLGGPIRRAGDPGIAEVLARALAATSQLDARELTHAFHVYPARMHPAIARTVLSELAPRAGAVLDPFVGSGTIMVEAVLRGLRGVGVDLNPIALRLARVKSMVRSSAERDVFRRRLHAVAAASLARVRARAAARAPLTQAEQRLYGPHVLKELAGLLQEIRCVADETDRAVLEVVFSSIVVKFSALRGDTSGSLADKRIRKGLATEFFARKGEELLERWGELAARAPLGAPSPALIAGDARALPRLLGADRFELILTSPPYGGTYDYAAHHALRCRWLGLSLEPLLRHEIGSRRELSATEAASRWDEQLGSVLVACRSVLALDGRIVLVLGDAQIGGRRVPAADQIARIAPAAGLTLLAQASQPRPDPKGAAPPRYEHLLALSAR